MPLFPPSPIGTEFTATNKLIYSPPKQGKSTLAAAMIDSQGRKPAIIGTEDGYKSIAGAQVARVHNWEGFLKAIEYLEARKEQLVQENSCIVLDLASDLDMWCEQHVAKIKKVEHVSDLDLGKGWHLLRAELGKAFSRVLALSPTTFIAHDQEKRLVWNGEKIVTRAPSLSKAATEFINGKCDAIMYIRPANTKKPYPELTMVPMIDHIAGARQRALCRSFVYEPGSERRLWQQLREIYFEAQSKLDPNEPAPTLTTLSPQADAVAAPQ